MYEVIFSGKLFSLFSIHDISASHFCTRSLGDFSSLQLMNRRESHIYNLQPIFRFVHYLIIPMNQTLSACNPFSEIQICPWCYHRATQECFL